MGDLHDERRKTRFFDYNFCKAKISAQNDIHDSIFLYYNENMTLPLGTTRKALAFQLLPKRGLGDIPKSLGGKVGFKRG